MKRTLFVMFVLVLMGSFAFGQSNEATVDQDGTSLEATILQTGADNEGEITQRGGTNKDATITQIGLDNFGSILQSGTGNYPDLTRGIQYQEGDENEAFIIQTGRSVKAFQTQYGINNYAIIEQKSYVDAYQDQGEQGQYGNDNWAEIDQGQNYAANRSQATQLQIGDDNKAYIYQRGTQGNDASQKQQGNDNWAGINQGGSYNFADIEQYGDNNKVASVSLSSDLTFVFESGVQENGGNYLKIFQDGIDGGVGNTVGFYQNKGAWADISQTGDDNTALLWQDGNHKAWITQTGGQNEAKVQQHNTP